MNYILVTGVSSGIGYAIAERLIQHGFFVFGSVRQESMGEKLAQQFGTNFRPLYFDLRDEVAIQRAREQVAQELGDQPLYALINNAGISLHGPLQFLQMDDIQTQFEVNITGTLRVTKAFLELLGARRTPIEQPGRIINISSLSGLITTPFLTPYCASKYALESLADGLRLELFPYGIKVVSIVTGPVATPIWDKALEDAPTWEETIYEPLFRHQDALLRRYLTMAVPPTKVAQLVHKVILRKRPRPRYFINSMRVITSLHQLLPVRWIDRVYKEGIRYGMRKR